MQGHNQYYKRERSFPILSREEIEESINEEEIPEPTIVDISTPEYQKIKGIIFLTIETADHELNSPEENSDYLVL